MKKKPSDNSGDTASAFERLLLARESADAGEQLGANEDLSRFVRAHPQYVELLRGAETPATRKMIDLERACDVELQTLKADFSEAEKAPTE